MWARTAPNLDYRTISDLNSIAYRKVSYPDELGPHAVFRGAGSPAYAGNRTTQEDAQRMAHVEDEQAHGLDAGTATMAESRRGNREPRPVPIQRAKWASSDPSDQDGITADEYAKLLDVYDSSFRNIAEGEVMKGTVLKVTPSEVIVDVGYKSEGVIAITEFLDERGEVTVQPGDTVDVLLERTEDREGYVVLSREKAEKMKIWDEVEKAFAERKVVIGRVI